MKLFGKRRKKTEPVIPPELQPYYGNTSGASRSNKRRLWLLVAAIVVILIVIGIVIWLILRQPNTVTKPHSQATQSPQSNSILDKSAGKPAKTPLSDNTNTETVKVP